MEDPQGPKSTKAGLESVGANIKNQNSIGKIFRSKFLQPETAAVFANFGA